MTYIIEIYSICREINSDRLNFKYYSYETHLKEKAKP
ncbi:hypothetical protein OKW21_003133 [Catalinimonas alkaloidigena]|nr:hypothetical protein [Catalinimonas alkaloidigena]